VHAGCATGALARFEGMEDPEVSAAVDRRPVPDAIAVYNGYGYGCGSHTPRRFDLALAKAAPTPAARSIPGSKPTASRLRSWSSRSGGKA